MPDPWGHTICRSDLLRRVGRLEQAAGVRLVVLGDGVERGARVVEFRKGSGFAFVDRAFNTGRCEFREYSLAWLSATGVVRAWVRRTSGSRLVQKLGRRDANDVRTRPCVSWGEPDTGKQFYNS